MRSNRAGAGFKAAYGISGEIESHIGRKGGRSQICKSGEMIQSQPFVRAMREASTRFAAPSLLMASER